MRRWLAFVVSVIAGGVAAFAAILVLTVTLYGFLWIYVFGDNSWPEWLGRASDVVVPVLGLAIWTVAAWIIWKRLSGSSRAG